MTRVKSVICSFGLLLSSVVILAVLLEAVLTIMQINTKSTTRFIPTKGTTFIPNAHYRFTKEGFSEGHFNSHGFRDYERTDEGAANTFRILIFGDSYVEALQTALSDTFPALLEKRLNQNSAATRFEVLALGQSGFGTAEEYMRYVNFGVQYSPDLVILAFLTGNDFQDNSKFLSQESHEFYFGFDKYNNLVLDRSFLDKYQSPVSPQNGKISARVWWESRRTLERKWSLPGSREDLRVLAGKGSRLFGFNDGTRTLIWVRILVSPGRRK